MPQSPTQSFDPLQIAAPGIVHAFANALFAIQNHASGIGGASGEITRQRQAVQRSTEQAQATLEILRFLVEDAGGPCLVQAGVLLRRLCDVLRVPLRDRGLVLECVHASNETPALVNGRALCRAVTLLLTALVAVTQRGSALRIVVDLTHQTACEAVVAIRVQGQTGFLPFPLPLVDCVAMVAAPIRASGAEPSLDPDSQTVHIHVPVGLV